MTDPSASRNRQAVIYSQIPNMFPKPEDEFPEVADFNKIKGQFR